MLYYTHLHDFNHLLNYESRKESFDTTYSYLKNLHPQTNFVSKYPFITFYLDNLSISLKIYHRKKFDIPKTIFSDIRDANINLFAVTYATNCIFYLITSERDIIETNHINHLIFGEREYLFFDFY